MILIPKKNIMPEMEVLKRKLHINRPLELEKLRSIMDRANKALKPCYAFKKIRFGEDVRLFSQIQRSKSLSDAVGEAKEGFVVICTIGDSVCKLLSQYQKDGDMVSAMYLDRFLSDAVENLAECSSLELLERFYDETHILGQRFSPGYGDLALDFQKVIFSFFDGEDIEVKINQRTLWPRKIHHI
jgi:hypothetical protein